MTPYEFLLIIFGGVAVFGGLGAALVGQWPIAGLLALVAAVLFGVAVQSIAS